MARSALVPSMSWVAVIALLAAMQVNAISKPPTFVVQVEDGLLDQVSFHWSMWSGLPGLFYHNSQSLHCLMNTFIYSYDVIIARSLLRWRSVGQRRTTNFGRDDFCRKHNTHRSASHAARLLFPQ